MNEVLIKLIDVKKSYKIGDGYYQALNGISFEIMKGEFISVIGPSGSGKSTLMHILGALDNPTSGKYFLNGEDVSSLNETELASIRNRRIGFVFQSFNLLPRTSVLDNVILPLTYAKVQQNERKKRAMDSLKAVEIDSKAINKPNQLSGGQMQRVAIARAIVTNPSIILADEPTGNLDTKTSEEVLNIFKNMNSEGKTIILITHEKEIAMKADRIISLKDGLMISDESIR